jgi:hypothetical protein
LRADRVGEVIEGAARAAAGLALFSRALGRRGRIAEVSIAGSRGALPLSSSVIAILKVPSTITTTLAPTSSERIFEVMVEASLRRPCLVDGGDLGASRRLAAASRPSRWRCAAAACAARRAAAMKLDELTVPWRAAEISLITLSEAAMRSDGDERPACGRVPGSSG